MNSEPLIICENLVKIYRLDQDNGASIEVQALQGLDITVADGEMIGIVGASGSGKSTLLNILGGLDRPTGGHALVGRQDLGNLNERALDEYRLHKVGFVWQQATRNLIPYLTALENVELPLTLSGQVGKSNSERALELLELVGLRERMNHRIEELSGGEQQRVAVAIALANRPKLLLADEPTGELDTATAKSIYDLFRVLNKQLGLTIVIVSHDLGIAQYVDRVVAVRDGKLASETLRVQKSDSEEHHLVELAVLDSAGRLQIPREYLEQFHIKRRVQMEITDEGILIRPPEGNHHSHDHSLSSSEQEPVEDEALQVPSGWSKIWQSFKSRFARGGNK
ncbi:MAG: ABC transporter ATP-binding protein [Anaerolineae bacterium]|nr:ABC transporter ATP-binding protein [Anaerolineae bacterium]MCI0608374.1 ABC transporter ATP-binding protein [Anaerolineae bacterium]